MLAFGCLLVFLVLGSFYYVNWVVQRPFAIILFLSDNLTPSVLTPTRNYAGGADHRLAMEGLPHVALISTHANDFAVADAVAATGAIATGRKGNKGELGVEHDNKRLPTLLELADRRGRATGIVSNASLTDATAATFFSSTNDELDYTTLALELSSLQFIDVMLGGGAGDFLPAIENGRRNDGRNLFREMRDAGFDVVRTESELLEVPTWRSPKTIGVFAMNNLNFVDQFSSEAGQPSLALMVRKAIQLLQYNAKGYFLVVDAALSGKAASQNEAERTVREMLALDEAVAEALRYAGADSLIIVAGKRSVGGLRLNGFPFRNDNGAALVGTNAQGIPSFTWSTGPGSGTHATDSIATSTEPSARQLAAGIEVVEDSLALGSGPGSESLHGFMDNTQIFQILNKNF